MNTYTFNELSIGFSNEFQIFISEKKMSQFEELTGDINPMHLDINYAKAHKMKSRVVYGLLTSSFYSTLIGVYLPGKFALLHSIDIHFLKPVYIGDILKVKGEIVEVNDTFKQIIVKGSILNQDGQKVSRAKIKAGVLK